jgi:hypothetical protein
MRLLPAAFLVVGATQVLAQVPESYTIRVLVGDTRSGGAARLATDVALPGPAALAELGDGSLLIGGGNPHFGIGFTDTRVEALRRVTPDGRLEIAGRLLALSQSYGGVAVEPDGSLLYVDGCVIYRLPAWNSTSQGEVVAGIRRQSCLEEGDPTGRPATGATFSFIRTIARSSRGEIAFSTDAGSLIRMGQDGRLTLLSRGQFATDTAVNAETRHHRW